MALVVASNMAALNTYNALKRNDKKMANNLEKVSSGMKINSAKDDASVYAISEKMRVRIRALEQDDQNVKNGKSLLFVAHGGIQEIVNNLRTIKEMALNAANDTNTDEDRAIIQKELEQRKLQIDDIASTTEFNGKYLLNGSLKSRHNNSSIISNGYSNYKVPTVDKGKITPVSNSNNTNNYSFTITEDGIYGLNFNPGSSSTNQTNCTIYIDCENVSLKEWHIGNYTNLHIVCLRDNTNIFLDGSTLSNYKDESNITFGAGRKNTLTTSYSTRIRRCVMDDPPVINTPIIDIGGGLTILDNRTIFNNNPGLSIYEETWGPSLRVNSPVIGPKANSQTNANIIIDTKHEDSLNLLVCYDKNDCNVACIGSDVNGSISNIVQKSGTVVVENAHISGEAWFPELYGAGVGGSIGNILYDHIDHWQPNANRTATRSYPASVDDIEDIVSDDEYKDGMIIHTGTKANENIHINIDDMHCEALGIGNIKVVNRDAAINSLSYIDAAIDKALGEITDVGAYMSRMDFTDNNIITAQENITSAESVIRDADMAKEMTDYSKHNVLLQAAQSMLAQANQNSSMVLSLLQ